MADRVLKGYSGGMRRRLDLAASLMTRPPVLFLDEPTTGLDPVSRQRVWDAVRDLLDEGVTVLLTTQYLDEADALAHRIVVVDHGMVIADGTPQELKEASRSVHLEVTLAIPHADAVGAIAPLVAGRWTRPTTGGGSPPGRRVPGLATAVVRALDAAGVLVDNIEVRQPSLDDVFFSLTGGHIEEEEVGGAAGEGEGDGQGRARANGRQRRRWRARVGGSTSMTTTTLTPTATAQRARSSQRLLGPLADTWAMTRRNLVHISREPMQLSDVTIQPVLFTVLFVYIFGGAIPIPGGGTYVDYLLAGMLALNLVTSTMGTAVGLSTDLHEGMIDRFRTLPMWRSAVLVGRSMADLLTSCLCALIVGIVGLAVGWRADASLPAIVAGFLLVLFFAYSLTWIAACVGLNRRAPSRRHRSASSSCSLWPSSPMPWCRPCTCRAGCRRSQLEPGERRVRRGPGLVGEPEPFGSDRCVADATSRRGFVDLVGVDHRRGRSSGRVFLQAAEHRVGLRAKPDPFESRSQVDVLTLRQRQLQKDSAISLSRPHAQDPVTGSTQIDRGTHPCGRHRTNVERNAGDEGLDIQRPLHGTADGRISRSFAVVNRPPLSLSRASWSHFE